MWRANSPKTHPPYQTPCWIKTRDGEEYEAELIQENDNVVEWRLAIDI
jgi:hypothetical protein